MCEAGCRGIADCGTKMCTFKKPNTDDFSVAKVGEKLWCSLHGDVTVAYIDKNQCRPLYVLLSNGTRASYRFDGKFNLERNQTLFWSNPNIIAPARVELLPDLKIDQKVLVWNDTCYTKYKRHFSHFSPNGDINTFESGCTSFTVVQAWGCVQTSKWKHYEVCLDAENPTSGI